MECDPLCGRCRLPRGDHLCVTGDAALYCPDAPPSLRMTSALRLGPAFPTFVPMVTPHDPPCERCDRPRSHHWPYAGLPLVCPDDQVSLPSGPRRLFRRRKADMPRYGVAPHPSVPLGLYEHHKGDRYRVVGGIFDAEGTADEVKVAYVAVDDPEYACFRSVADFVAPVRRADGETVPRFRLVDPVQATTSR
jgi:hypothetical protein